MATPSFHLAQINIGRMRGPLDDPIMADFVNQLDAINALAEQSPGFVWRLQDDGGNATSIRVFDDDRILVNMSVWESLEQLRDYVYKSDHIQLLRARKQWFERIDLPPLALWWIPAGTLPMPAEGQQRLEHLHQHGASPYAFTFQQTIPMPSSLPVEHLSR